MCEEEEDEEKEEEGGRKCRKKNGEGGRMEGLILSTKMIFMM